MNQQPDKLFRDKLENYQKGVPASAWDRIAATQPKKKRPGVWLNIAASLLLVAGVGATWLLTRPVTHNQLSDRNLPTHSETAPTLEPDGTTHSNPDGNSSVSEALPTNDQTANESIGTSKKNLNRAHQKINQNNSRVARERSKISAEPAVVKSTADGNDVATRTSPATNDLSIELEQTLPVDETISNSNLNSDQTRNAKASTVAAAGVTLTYSTEDVSAYLEKNSTDEATEEEKKESTFKKLLQKANDLKTNQDPVGELRQRKNEILALNFMNDKRGQKTRN